MSHATHTIRYPPLIQQVSESPPFPIFLYGKRVRCTKYILLLVSFSSVQFMFMFYVSSFMVMVLLWLAFYVYLFVSYSHTQTFM